MNFIGQWKTAGVAAAFAAWLCAGVWPLRNRRRFLAWNYALQRIWAGGFAKAGIALFSLRLAIDGGYAFGDKPFLMLVRHTRAWQSSTSVLVGGVLSRSVNCQPRASACSMVTTSAGHQGDAWMVAARSGPVACSRVASQLVVRLLWRSASWLATVGVRCRQIRHHRAEAA